MGSWRGRSYRADMYDGVGASAITSNVEWIGDAADISLFIRGTGSVTTVQLSNADGRHTATGQASIPETSWSDATTVTSPSPDMLDIEPGPRWIRSIRSETTEVTLNWKADFR